jgi:ribosomal protein S18
VFLEVFAPKRDNDDATVRVLGKPTHEVILGDTRRRETTASIGQGVCLNVWKDIDVLFGFLHERRKIMPFRQTNVYVYVYIYSIIQERKEVKRWHDLL